MFDILYLILDLLELFLLGADQLLATAGAFLQPAIDAAVQFGLQFVAIPYFGAQQPPIENVGAIPIMGNCRMDLPKIDARNAALRKWADWSRLVIGGNGFVLRAGPMKDNSLRQTPWPVEDQWFVALAIGET